MRKISFSTLILSLLITQTGAVPLRAETASGMVVSAHPLASKAGLRVLREGGNAVDAAIAVQFALNTVEPQSSGIGGGCFMLIYLKEQDLIVFIDGREEAPRSVYEEYFLDENGQPLPFYPERITGGKAAGVPGTVRAVYQAWRYYGSGKISWEKLFAPAIRLARKGFMISPGLANDITEQKDRLALFPSSREIFFDKKGRPKKAGVILKQKDLAETFSLLAAQGSAVFYEGAIASDIIRAVNEDAVNPGNMTADDLREYQAVLRQPLRGEYRGYKIVSAPPPSSGGSTLLEALNLLEMYPLREMGRQSIDFAHLFSEAQRVAFADRNRFLGDPDFSAVPVRELSGKDWAAQRQIALRNVPVPEFFSGTGNAPENISTSHISVVDAQGNAVAMTTTIEHIFGSGLVVPGRGFVLNNELTDFAAEPYLDAEKKELSPNRAEGRRARRRSSLDFPRTRGGKRPLSSMTPTLVFKEGELFAVAGSPGGTQIIGIVLNTLVNVIDFNMSAQEAVAAPRLINRGNGLEMEKAAEKEAALMRKIKSKQYPYLPRDPFGDAQVIVIRDGKISGASDPRGEGRPLLYQAAEAA